MKHHPEESDLRAALDGELQEPAAQAVQLHLADCQRCSALYASLTKRRDQTLRLFAAFPPARERPESPSWQQFKTYRTNVQKEKIDMMKRKTYRPAWIALIAVLVIGASLAFPQVRALATDFLGIFRVQQITILPVNLAEVEEFSGMGANLEHLMSDQVVIDKQGETQPVENAAQASQAAGFNARLPEDAPAVLLVQPAVHGEFTLDTDKINGILDEIGRSDARLDPALDGRKVIVDVQPAVIAGFGECEARSLAREQGTGDYHPEVLVGEQCTTLVQLPSPVVETPDGLDIPKLGQTFLELSGMSQEEASAFAQSIDWSSTLIIPIPMQDTVTQEIQVDGVNGHLVREDPDSGSPQYVILWVRAGILYGLAGTGDPQAGIDLANNLQ